MYCNATDGTDPGTQFSFFTANSLSPLTGGLNPYSSVLIKSKLTGKYCRTVVVPSSPPGQDLNIMCDVDDPANATTFTYTSSKFQVGPEAVTKPCDGCPLYIGGPGTNATGEPGGLGAPP